MDLCNLLFIHSENLHSACSRSLRGQTNDSNEVLGVTDESLKGVRNIYSVSLALCNFRLSNRNETSIISIGVRNDPMTFNICIKVVYIFYSRKIFMQTQLEYVQLYNNCRKKSKQPFNF